LSLLSLTRPVKGKSILSSIINHNSKRIVQRRYSRSHLIIKKNCNLNKFLNLQLFREVLNLGREPISVILSWRLMYISKWSPLSAYLPPKTKMVFIANRWQKNWILFLQNFCQKICFVICFLKLLNVSSSEHTFAV